MKLTEKKVKWLIRRKEEGESSSVIARSLGISVRRVNQVWREYKDGENIPAIGEHGKTFLPDLNGKRRSYGK